LNSLVSVLVTELCLGFFLLKIQTGDLIIKQFYQTVLEFTVRKQQEEEEKDY
jgi:hypothetical protein